MRFALALDRRRRYLWLSLFSTMTLMHMDLAFGKTDVTGDLPDGFQYRVLDPLGGQKVHKPVKFHAAINFTSM